MANPPQAEQLKVNFPTVFAIHKEHGAPMWPAVLISDEKFISLVDQIQKIGCHSWLRSQQLQAKIMFALSHSIPSYGLKSSLPVRSDLLALCVSNYNKNTEKESAGHFQLRNIKKRGKGNLRQVYFHLQKRASFLVLDSLKTAGHLRALSCRSHNIICVYDFQQAYERLTVKLNG